MTAVCPECQQGKCGNCDGTAWDAAADAPTSCQCPATEHQPAVAPFSDIDRYVQRPDVPGHVFTRVGELRQSSWGYSVTCSCGAAFDWVVSPEVMAVENRHRIEVSS